MPDSATNPKCQDIGTQTKDSFMSDFSCMAAKHLGASADPATALAEGTRLLMAASRHLLTRHQHALTDNAQLTAAVQTAPWTLLTQSNIQLRLKPQVAAAGTQTEEVCQSDEPSDSTLAHIDTASINHGSSERQHSMAQPVAALDPPLKRSCVPGDGLAPVVSHSNTSKHSPQLQIIPSAMTLRSASLHRRVRSPNAQFMFQSEQQVLPCATFEPEPPQRLPPSLLSHQAGDCSTPVKIHDTSCRRSSLTSLPPAADGPTVPTTDSAIGKHSNSKAVSAVSNIKVAVPFAADPSEIQLTDAGMTSSSCKSASTSTFESSCAVKGHSHLRPTADALAPSGRTERRDSARSQLLPRLDAVEVVTTVGANSIATARQSLGHVLTHSTDINSSKAVAAAEHTAALAELSLSSAAAAAVDAALAAATSGLPESSNIHQGTQASPVDLPMPTAHKSTHSSRQSHAEQGPSQPSSKAGSRPSKPAARADQGLSPLAPKGTSPTLGQLAAAPAQQGPLLKEQPRAPSSSTPAMLPEAAAAAAADVTCTKDVASSSPPEQAQHHSQAKTRGKSQAAAPAKPQLGSPRTVDALRLDLMSTAGCHVTRRLVQRLLEPVSQTANSTGADPPKVSGTSAQPAPSKRKASRPKKVSQTHNLVGSSAANSSAKAADTATQSKPTTQKAAEAKLPMASASQALHQPAGTRKSDKTQSVSELHKQAGATKPTTDKKTAGHSTAADSSRLAPAKPALASKPIKNSTAGKSKASGSTTALASTPVKSSTAGKSRANSGITVVQGCAAVAACKPSGSVSKGKDPQPSYSTAGQARSSLKREPSDASAASPPAKKPKVSILSFCT